MNFLLLPSVYLIALSLFLLACSGKKEDASGKGGDSAPSNLEMIFSSSNISAASLLRPFAGSNCSVTTDMGGAESGKCYTPTTVGGIFNSASLGSTSGGAPVRILGGGNLSGLAAVFNMNLFDLKTSPSISGEDNIQDGSSGSYNLLSMTVQSIEYSFVGTSQDQHFHVRVPFVATPPSSSSAFANCGLGGGIDEADQLGTFYGGRAISPGDILVCIKSSDSEFCSDADFKWVDSSGSTHDTRPSSPLRLSGSYLATEDSCIQNGGDHRELNWGYANLDLMLSSPVSVSAEINGGVKTYRVGSSSGNKLTANIDVVIANSLFVPASALSTDLSTATETQILQSLSSIQLKPIYIKNRKSNASPGIGDMNATVSFTVSTE